MKLIPLLATVGFSTALATTQCTEGDDTSCDHMNPEIWDTGNGAPDRPSYCGKFRNPAPGGSPFVFECSCNDGYSKNNRKQKCEDKDECALNQHRCNRQTQTCQNTIGGYKCICNDGFQETTYGPNKQIHCVDKNECNDRQGEFCGPKELYTVIRRNGLCKNTQGGYECDCNKKGFEFDRVGSSTK